MTKKQSAKMLVAIWPSMYFPSFVTAKTMWPFFIMVCSVKNSYVLLKFISHWSLKSINPSFLSDNNASVTHKKRPCDQVYLSSLTSSVPSLEKQVNTPPYSLSMAFSQKGMNSVASLSIYCFFNCFRSISISPALFYLSVLIAFSKESTSGSTAFLRFNNPIVMKTIPDTMTGDPISKESGTVTAYFVITNMAKPEIIDVIAALELACLNAGNRPNNIGMDIGPIRAPNQEMIRPSTPPNRSACIPIIKVANVNEKVVTLAIFKDCFLDKSWYFLNITGDISCNNCSNRICIRRCHGHRSCKQPCKHESNQTCRQ